MLYLIVHQPPADPAFGETFQTMYMAHEVQVSTWLLQTRIPTAHALLAELKRIPAFDPAASLLVTEVSGSQAGWQTFMPDDVMEHFKSRHYPADSTGRHAPFP